MTNEGVDREWEAAKRLVRSHRPAGVVLRLSSDGTGYLRLRLEGVEGVSIETLAPPVGAVDRPDTIKRT